MPKPLSKKLTFHDDKATDEDKANQKPAAIPANQRPTTTEANQKFPTIPKAMEHQEEVDPFQQPHP